MKGYERLQYFADGRAECMKYARVGEAFRNETKSRAAAELDIVI